MARSKEQRNRRKAHRQQHSRSLARSSLRHSSSYGQHGGQPYEHATVHRDLDAGNRMGRSSLLHNHSPWHIRSLVHKQQRNRSSAHKPMHSRSLAHSRNRRTCRMRSHSKHCSSRSRGRGPASKQNSSSGNSLRKGETVLPSLACLASRLRPYLGSAPVRYSQRKSSQPRRLTLHWIWGGIDRLKRIASPLLPFCPVGKVPQVAL